MANNRKDVFLRGKAKFCKLQDKGDVQFQEWNTVLYLTPESYKQFLDLKAGSDTVEGIMNEIKRDEDGHNVKLKRPWFRKYKGLDVSFTPPIVLGPDNMPWPAEKTIGSGSDITLKLEYYTFKPPFKQKKGAAIRIVSVRIEEYVPFQSKDFNDAELEQIKGLTDMKPMVDNPPF